MAQMTRIKAFGGIDWSQSENNMALGPVCRTLDGLNFVTGRGSLLRRTVETPYAMPEIPGSTVMVQSLLYFSNMGVDGNRQTWVMAGVKIEGGETRYDLMAKGPGYSGWTSIKGQNTLTSADFVFVSFRYEDRSAVIFSNGSDDVWQWEGAGAIIKLAPIIAPRSKCMSVCNGRLWMASSDWQSVCCSAAYDAANWSQPDAVTITLPGAGGERITALVNYQDSLLIFTAGSIYRLFGHSIDDFELTRVCSSAGTAAQHCAAEWNGKLFFSYREIICLYDGMDVQVYLPGRLPPAEAAANYHHLAVVGNTLYINSGLTIDLLRAEVTALQAGTGETSWALLLPLPSGELLAAFSHLGISTTVYNWSSILWGAVSGALYARFRVPSTDLGQQEALKRLTGIYVNGRGGRVKITPVCDNKPQQAVELTLPPTFEIVFHKLSGSGRLVGLIIETVEGDPIWINGVTLCYEAEVD